MSLPREEVSEKKKENLPDRARAYTYFDFRLDVAGEPFIHSRNVVVIRVLDLHDALHCVSLFAAHEAGKEAEREKRGGKKKKNNDDDEKPISGRTPDSLGQ